MNSIAIIGDNAQQITYTGTAGVTPTFGPTRALLVWTTSDAYVKVGASVTATTNDLPMPAYTPMMLSAAIGSTAAIRVSAVQISAGGTVYAKPVGDGHL